MEEAAAAGCEKCKKEHETGIQTRKSHDDNCPRKAKPRGLNKTNSKSEIDFYSAKKPQHDTGCNMVDQAMLEEGCSKPYHQATLKEAAAQGCSKCKKEFISGIKTTSTHDVGCPRRRGAWGSQPNHFAEGVNEECTKCKKQREIGKSVPGPHIKGCPMNPKNAGKSGCKSICSTTALSDGGEKEHKGSSMNLKNAGKSDRKSIRSTATLPGGGDPPWRSKGNGWIGRRILYKPNAAKEETRACTKNRFYVEDESHDGDETDSSAIKGTILGFISERDKDSDGNPGFVCSKTGLPAMLFHVVFDQNENLLLNKDFEEWEIKEQCEWIYEETDSEDEGPETQQEDSWANEKDPFEVQEKTHSPKEIRVGSKTTAETKVSSRKATPKQNPKNVSPATSTRLSKASVSRSVSSNKVANRKATSRQKIHDSVDSSVAMNPIEQIINTAVTNETAKVDAIIDDKMSEKNFASRAEEVAKPNLSNCSSFNEALKSALSSYASSSALRNSNNPPPPVPPPFLSHQEESTLRTALAFVMIKARNKQKQKSSVAADGDKSVNSSLIVRKGSAHQSGRIGFGRFSSLNPQKDAKQNLSGRNQSILGGLLSQSRTQGRIGRLSSQKTMLTFDREMSHIRDILKLALSAVMPLYRGALDVKEPAQGDETCQEGDDDEGESNDAKSSDARNGDSKRLPSAIYDFEAGYMHISSAASGETPVDRHYASLDGLCQHGAMRLARLINEAAVISRLEQRASVQNEVQEKSPSGDPKEKPAGSIVTESSRGEDSRGPVRSKQIIHDAIVKLFYEDLIGSAFYDEQLDVDYCYERISADRIEKIMAACHVIHRLLFFDQCNSFASECTIAISRTLADIFHSTYIGSFSSPTHAPSASNVIQADKRKIQVVKPNWMINRTTYSNDRFERRSRGIDAMFRTTNPVLGGAKRKNAVQSIEDASATHLLPDVVDVLTVNLLRLLECVSEIRLHHHHRSSMLHQTRTNPAADIIKEIRSTNAVELMMPIHLDEAAALYLRHPSSEPSLLRPCAKLMLRLHFFGFIKKLSEQV